MVDSWTGARKLQDELGTSCCARKEVLRVMNTGQKDIENSLKGLPLDLE